MALWRRSHVELSGVHHIYMRFIFIQLRNLFNQIFPSYTIIIISKRCYISQIYNIVKKAIGNSEVGGLPVYNKCRNPFLPSFLRDKKCNVCVPFQKKIIGGIPEKKKNPKNAQKKIVLLKERKNERKMEKERNDHASVSLIKNFE